MSEVAAPNTKTAHSCPYAKAVEEEDSSVPGLVELQACPAFSNKECPFKGLAPDEVSKKLEQIPPSHLRANGPFHKTLEFFHHQHKSQGGEMGCPVKHVLPPDFSFDRAMEEFSLAAIMGKQAQEWEIIQAAEDASTASDEEGSTTTLQTETLPPPTTKLTSRVSLSDALKQGTASAHEAAESVHFVKNFIRGKIDRDLYGSLVAQLYHVYKKLESALDEHAQKHFGKCHFPLELNRTESLQEDVEFWHTNACPPISPATQDYLDRIDHLCKTTPLLLLAHAYTRYLGDLSGGKVLSRVARRALKLTPEDPGLAFYHFEHVKSFKLFKDKYRASLNALDLSKEDIATVVQEANIAFLLNMRLFEELDVLGGVQGATVRPLEEVYRLVQHTDASNAEEAQEGEARCPFLVEKSKTEVATNRNEISMPSRTTGTCPWPFVLLHDPKAGMKQWQTWVTIGLVLAYTYQATFLARSSD